MLSSGVGDCGSPSVSQVLTTAPQPAPPGAGRCVLTQVAIDSGPNAGANTLLEFSPGPGQPKLAVGDHIRLVRQVDDQGATSYAFYDFERGWSLVALAVAFAVVIVAVARWRGLLALVGIVVAFVVLVVFLLPALRDGAPAVPVALVASAAILYAVIYLAHGVSLRTSAALLGTLTSLLLAAGLSWAAIRTGPFDRLVRRPERHRKRVPGQCVDRRPAARRLHHRVAGCAQRCDGDPGLDGVRARPPRRASRRAIFLGAIRVGRDHIASTVYTLVLAYAGSSLPLLLLFSVANRSLTDVLTSESVAIEIARSAVGGIALALSVPLTTAIAAVLARPSEIGSAPTGPADSHRTRT